MRFLEEKDNFVRHLMIAIANDAREHQRQHDEQRASQIANAVGKMLGG